MLSSKYINHKFFISGDFNLPLIAWSYDDTLTKYELPKC